MFFSQLIGGGWAGVVVGGGAALGLGTYVLLLGPAE